MTEQKTTKKVTIQELDRKYYIHSHPYTGYRELSFAYDTYEYAEFACQKRGWEIVEPKERGV